PSKRQVDEVFVHSGVPVSGAGSVSSVVLPLETGLVDTRSRPAASLAFRFAQMQIDDHVRTLQNLPDAHTEQPFTPQPHPAAPHTPSPSPHPEQLQLLTLILASMQHQPCATTAVAPHATRCPPFSSTPSNRGRPNCSITIPTTVAVVPALPLPPPPLQPTLLSPQQPPLLSTAVDFGPPPPPPPQQPPR
ncbi:unnamed protein product, partial [Pylaiella littoralis]